LTFLFPWAASITYTGANGYLMAIIFIFILIIGLIYETIKGALNSR
jgi:NADH-quinone oxidoreductase subunit A